MMKIKKESKIPNIVFKIIFRILFILGNKSPKLRGLAFFVNANKRFPRKKIKSFNDAIYSRKMDLWDKDMSMYVDKIRVRDYVAEVVGKKYLVPIQGVYDSWNEIDFSQLRYPCVLKSSHACEHVAFLNSQDDFNKDKMVEIDEWLKCDYYKFGGEPTYRNIHPRLLVENRINAPGMDLRDYKFHCFAGKVKSITVDTGRFVHLRRCHYSPQWEKQQFTLGMEYYSGEIERPDNLEEMVEVAEALSSKFKYIRIDLYNHEGNIYFGEMTFSHGNAGSQNSSRSWDRWLAEQYLAVQGIPGLI